MVGPLPTPQRVNTPNLTACPFVRGYVVANKSVRWTARAPRGPHN